MVMAEELNPKIELTADVTGDVALDIEKWLADKMAEKFGVDKRLITGAGDGGYTMTTATQKSLLTAMNKHTHGVSAGFTVDDPEPAESPLRRDARLVQILRGVKAGTIAVEDAALEIVEGRGLDRCSILPDSTQADVVEPAKPGDRINGVWPKTLIGIPIVLSHDVAKPILMFDDYKLQDNGAFAWRDRFGTIDVVPAKFTIVDDDVKA